MAEEPDRESRTEEATEKRLQDAVAKGNVPFAREAVTFGSLLALLLVCLVVADWAVRRILVELHSLLSHAGEIELGNREATAVLLTTLGVSVAAGVFAMMAVLAGGAVIGSLVQNVPSVAVERIKPKMARISPSAGWKRHFGQAGLVEFAKSVLKLVAITIVTILTLNRHVIDLQMSLQQDPALIGYMILGLVTKVVASLVVFALLLAIADLAWSRFKWRRDLRMTRHEVKEEMKQAEGDPNIKARVRSVARQMSSRRMLDKMPTATMVIANPTHYAVALRYARDEAGAPVVVAKGLDFMALRIREMAADHDIPVVEDKPLARALYGAVSIDTQIPPEFYRAVAEIIHFLNSRRRPVVPAAHH